MHKKYTLNHHANQRKNPDEAERDVAMNLGDVDMGFEDGQTLFSPSESSIRSILDFAASYYCLKFRSIELVDMSLN